MRKIEIAIGLLEQGDRYVLQRRAESLRLGASGLIGCFGGQIKEREEPEDTVVRELGEETNLQTRRRDWESLGELDVVSDRDNEPVEIHAYAFRCTLSKDLKLKAFDGEAVSLPQDAIGDYESQLTPATHTLFEEKLGVIWH